MEVYTFNTRDNYCNIRIQSLRKHKKNKVEKLYALSSGAQDRPPRDEPEARKRAANGLPQGGVSRAYTGLNFKKKTWK